MSSIPENKKKVNKIAAFTAYPWENALPKLRILNPASALGLQVIQGNDYRAGLSNIEFVKDADAVFIQRDFPRYLTDYRLLKETCIKYSKPIIYDIDDLLFDDIEYPNKDEADYYRPALGQILDAILTANVITTSSETLKSSLEAFSNNVRLVENYIDEEKWSFFAPVINEDRPLIIGYVGTRSHLKDLEQLYPVIIDVIKRCGDAVNFHLWIHSLPIELASIPQVTWNPFSLPNYDDYIQWISEIPVDIWIAPLTNAPFNQAKSPIKFLEYSTRAVPGVYSNIAPYQKVIEDGVNGFLANDKLEWVEKIVSLVNEDNLRLNMGLAAQETVKRNWLLSTNLSAWEKVWDDLVVSPSPQTSNNKGSKLAFDLLNLHYTKSIQTLFKLEGEMQGYKWLVADRDDVILQYAKLSQSVFVKSRNKFRAIQNRYFSLGSPQGKILNWIVKAILKKVNHPGVINQAKIEETDPAMKNPPSSISVSDPIRLALYTTDNWDTASAHIRLVGPAKYLNSGIKILNGCQVTTSANLEFFNNADVVIIQRDFPRHEQLYLEVVRWAHLYQKKVIYEIDDLLFDLPEEHPEKAYYQRYESLIRQAISNADAVVVSTIPLVNAIKTLNPNTWLLPNYLDDTIWSLERSTERKNDRRIILGYMAGVSQSHIPDIESLLNLLLRLRSEYPDSLCLHFWGGVGQNREQNPHVVYHKERFANYQDFASYFSKQDVDIFVAPLLDNPFNNCKSAIKFLEYSSMGVPGVYSDIKPYQNVIKQGQNGFLASGIKDWEYYLRLLIEDHNLRKRLGNSSYTTVIDQHLMRQHVTEWSALYKRLLMIS